MPKIFIDTNIFLGLYESNFNSLKIFKDIHQIEDNLVIPDQVYSEFVRNRDLILLRLINQVNSNFQLKLHSTSLVRSTEIFSKFKNIEENFKNFKNILIKELEEIQNNPLKDPIFKSFKELYDNKKVLKLTTNDEHIKKAQTRNILGNPPKSLDKGTICDELIWELLLQYIQEDLYVISRDGTFSKHLTYLSEEFSNKTGKKLFVNEELSEVLSLIGVKPSKSSISFDKEQKEIRQSNRGRISQFEQFNTPNISKLEGFSTPDLTKTEAYNNSPLFKVVDSYKDSSELKHLPSKDSPKKANPQKKDK